MKREQGLDVNKNLKQQRDFHNPEMLEKVIQHFSISQVYGSNYPLDKYDPSPAKIHDEDFYDVLAAEQKRWFQKGPVVVISSSSTASSSGAKIERVYGSAVRTAAPAAAPAPAASSSSSSGIKRKQRPSSHHHHHHHHSQGSYR